MSRHPCIEAKVVYGKEAERKLLPILSAAVGVKMNLVSSTFSTMDMEGKGVFAELKRRTSDFSYCDVKIKKEGWLMSSCKVIRAWDELSKGKRVFFFYFWDCDKSLWMYEVKEGDFTQDGDHFVPKYHYDNQLHVTIPQERWTRIRADLSAVVFEEERCWID